MIWLMTDTVWRPVADRVQHALRLMRHETFMLCPAVCAEMAVELVGEELRVVVDDTEVELPDSVLYLRDPVPHPPADAGLDNDALQFVTQQWLVVFRGLAAALHASGRPVLNPAASIVVNEKTAQVMRAAQLGFATPPTLHTAAGHHAEQFALDHGGRCASKPFSPFVGSVKQGGPVKRLLTNVIDADQLLTGLQESAVASPTIVQPFIAAPFEHRVVVVGDRVFGARIARTGANAVDVRRLPPDQADVSQSELPTDVQRRCVELVRSYGLTFAAIDLLETPDREFVFLDLNPSGHFLWVEQIAGAPICATLADELVAAARQPRMSSSSATMPA